MVKIFKKNKESSNLLLIRYHHVNNWGNVTAAVAMCK